MELGELREIVDELVARDHATLVDVEVREDLIELCRQADRIECEIARLAALAHRRGAGDELGQVSTAKWMEYATGRRVQDARRSIDAGLVLDELPMVGEAWAAGDLSASAARTICRGRHPDHGEEYASIEPMLVALATGHHYTDLDAVIRRYRQCIETEPTVRSGLHCSATTDGWQLDASFSRLDGAVVDAAIRAATMPPSAHDDRTAAERRADALVDICRHALGCAEAPLARAAHLDVAVDWGTFTGSVIGPADTPISTDDLHRLLCDSTLSRVITGPTGQPLDVGRRHRLATDAQRSAILVRDRRCRFPGCDRPPKWCEVHHIIPWEHGGPTDLANLVLLCSHHHHVLHKPAWQAHFDHDDFVVTTPTGHTMTSRARAPAAV